MFDDQKAQGSVVLRDTKKDREVKAGSRVKLQLTDVQVSEGTLILTGQLL